ncbi:HD domain-containing protein [Eubacterium sp.]|uniref:HD domain-containing protein n=1 Tax=Eubacterium sp. TaxID=142586 RepID=UPI003991631A
MTNDKVRIHQRVQDVMNVDELYNYIYRYVHDNNMEQSIMALEMANECHKEQTRMEGGPYIIHPLTIARHAISLGIKEDNIIATMLLHDVCEDCNISETSMPINDIVKAGVKAMTFEVKPGEDKEEARLKYFARLIDNREATITKMFDRCNNVSTMALIFSRKRLVKYINETDKHVIPLIQQARIRYSEFEQICFAVEYQMNCMLNSVEMLLEFNDSKRV